MKPIARSKVTILVKALNEEARIAACLEAALREARSVGGDVLLVDSLSTDRTVEIARQYPVRIVQFKNVADRGCGAAVQLGYQYVDPATPFLYVLDADMILEAGFIKKALSVLESDTGLAGVCGRLVDSRVLNTHDRRRLEAADRQDDDEFVDEMGGGGLYRSLAIQQVGYLAHRWLAAYEEFELGARLRNAGWRMKRLKDVAVVHEGHQESDLMTFVRLWRNGRAMAGGELIRSALNKPWFGRVIKKMAYIFVAPICYLSFAFPLDDLLEKLVSLFFAAILLFVFMLVRKRDLSSAAYSFVAWHFYGLSSVFGFFKKIRNPEEVVESVLVV